jgi:hypothetical protein
MWPRMAKMLGMEVADPVPFSLVTYMADKRPVWDAIVKKEKLQPIPYEQPAYMKCVFDSYTELTNGTAVKPDEVFDNLPAIIGRKPRTLADSAKKHADKFRYHLTEKIV